MKDKIIQIDNYGGFSSTIKDIEINNVTWRYSISGEGDKYLLAIMANVTGHILAIPLVESLYQEYKIIALSPPPLSAFSMSSEGIFAILKNENVEICDAIGHSNGGVHIQGLVSKYPNIVDKIIFSHSLTSMSPDDAFTTNASELSIYSKTKTLLKFIPISIFIWALTKQYFSNIKLEAGEEKTEYMMNLCKKELKKISKNDFLQMINCMEDFLYNHTISSEDYKEKASKMLILNSLSDKMVNNMQREKMVELCRNAEEYYFEKGGHIPMINCKNEYLYVVKNFLLKD